MLWLATKVRREPRLASATIVVVTDRIQLDRQIASTFERCGFPGPEQAATSRDISDINTRGRFIVCAEPVVPTVRGLTASKSGNTTTATWTFVPGCVATTPSDVVFHVEWDLPAFGWNITFTSDINTCTTSGNQFTCSYQFLLPPGTMTSKVSIYGIPKDREYGGYDYGGEGKKGSRQSFSVGPFEF